MQGKFKMVVIDNCGHVIQEDQPQQVANSLRSLIATLKVPINFNDQMYVTNVAGKKILISRWDRKLKLLT